VDDDEVWSLLLVPEGWFRATGIQGVPGFGRGDCHEYSGAVMDGLPQSDSYVNVLRDL
jgi:hypothetical protein